MEFFKWFFGMLMDERGQVGGETQDSGTTGEGETGAGETGGEQGSTDTGETETGMTEGDAGKQTAAKTVESFIDPKDLPPEIKPHWSRMHRAYTKFLGQKKELEEKAQLVDRFYSDAGFRRETLNQWAMQDGISLPQAQAGQKGYAARAAHDVPAEYVEMAKATLPTELQWMAESQAKLAYTVGRAMVDDALKPYKEQTQRQTAAQREREYDGMAEELSADIPGWEEHEDEMSELLTYLQSDTMRHKKFGSKLRLLYDMVTKNAAATQSAAKRLSVAGKNRTTSGQTVRTVDNTDERIRKAKSNDDAWSIAMKKAEEELSRQGRAVPT